MLASFFLKIQHDVLRMHIVCTFSAHSNLFEPHSAQAAVKISKLFKMGADRMSEAFKAEFSACLELKGKPPTEHFLELVGIIAKHGLMYELKEVHAKFFLVHLGNRGGLLLNPRDAHKNCAEIKAAGADLELLSNAYCFELPPHGPRRAAHIEKNVAFVDRSEGLVAEVNGSERFIRYIGCGHTSQFCKVADVGGITCEEEGAGPMARAFFFTNDKQPKKVWNELDWNEL